MRNRNLTATVIELQSRDTHQRECSRVFNAELELKLGIDALEIETLERKG